MALKKGLVHIYTGNGKGKTSAAIGLAVRAAGAGMKVYMQQFTKGTPTAELKALKNIMNITVERCGRPCFVKKGPSIPDVECARAGFEKASDAISSGKYDVVILDEINIAVRYGLIGRECVEDMIRHRPKKVELILTGRHCPKGLMKMADLVTEMKELKHPFRAGVAARRGIEY